MRRTLKIVSYSEARLSNAQDKVLEGYKERFNLEEWEVRDLHAFFSPTRVPKGLTREEIFIIILLCKIRNLHRRYQIERMEKIPGVLVPRLSTMLPPEFTSSERMTRGRFQKGIMKFLREAATS